MTPQRGSLIIENYSPVSTAIAEGIPISSEVVPDDRGP